MSDSNPSKSARKRDTVALTALGEQLTALSVEQLESLGLDDNLFDAVTAAGKMHSHGARRRQHRLIGKLMRNVNPEPIRRALDAMRRQDRSDKELFRRAEQWRDRLIQNGRRDLSAFFQTTGRRNSDLGALLDELAGARSAAGRRALGRKVFRLVHAELTAAMPAGDG